MQQVQPLPNLSAFALSLCKKLPNRAYNQGTETAHIPRSMNGHTLAPDNRKVSRCTQTNFKSIHFEA